jgi:hypothetical protein
MHDPDEESRPPDLPLYQLGSLLAQATAVAISLWALGLSCRANKNTLELARQNHLPRWKCEFDISGLKITNVGGAERRLSVDRFAIFTTAPQNERGLGRPQLFLMPDYYSREHRDYDGDRMVLSLSTPSGGVAFAGKISGAIQRAMIQNNATWGWIETETYARIACEDLLGVRMEQYYARAKGSWDVERITEDRWHAASSLRDSLRSARAVIRVGNADSADVARVVQACISALP